MALQKLIGGPDWDVVTNPDYALFADFHYFILSGSTERSNPWNSPPTPIAKVLNVTNITPNSVVANYVSSSGQLTNVILTSGSTTQITSQTIPLGLDNTAWLSASIVSDFTGSVTARPTGSRWFELESIRTISQDTYVYTIADGATTITRTNTGQPVVGSLRYRCSRTIPYVDNGWWIIRDLFDCTGGTTTTTTTTTTTSTTTTSTTTTTTIAPYCSFWTASNAFGAGYTIQYTYCGETGSTFIEIPANSSRILCVQSGQISNLGNPILLTEDSGSCIGTTTTTLAPTTTTTTTQGTTTTEAPFCTVWTASNAFGAGYTIKVKYCGDTSYSFPTVPPNSSIYVCVQNNDITNNNNPITLTSSSVACSGSIITTTTTAAPTTTTTTSTTTTTTTTLAPTTTTTTTQGTTTTTTLATQKYYVESCAQEDGGPVLSGIIEITNAPLLTSKIVRVNTDVVGYSCFQVFSTSTGTISLGTRSVTNIYTDCVDCTD